MVAAFGKTDAFTGLAQLPLARGAGQEDLQVEQGDSADFQPPLFGRVTGAFQAEFDPPGVAALTNAGAPGGGFKAALHGGVGHVGNAQLAVDILQQFDLAVEHAATAGGAQLHRAGNARTAKQAQQ